VRKIYKRFETKKAKIGRSTGRKTGQKKKKEHETDLFIIQNNAVSTARTKNLTFFIFQLETLLIQRLKANTLSKLDRITQNQQNPLICVCVCVCNFELMICSEISKCVYHTDLQFADA
jgi:hypothetical protein